MIDTAFLSGQTKDSDPAEHLLRHENTLLNNSAAGYACGIVTPCLPELKVNLDLAWV